MTPYESRKRSSRACGLAVLIGLGLLVAVVSLTGWYVFVPRSADLATVAEISQLPLPDDAALLQSSAGRFPWESVYAHLRLTEEHFERFRSQIDFELTRDPEMVQATVDVMRWHHGDRPDWWAPEGLTDPLAAWAARPAAPESEDWSRWVAILAEEKPDGSVEVYLHATQDP